MNYLRRKVSQQANTWVAMSSPGVGGTRVTRQMGLIQHRPSLFSHPEKSSHTSWAIPQLMCNVYLSTPSTHVGTIAIETVLHFLCCESICRHGKLRLRGGGGREARVGAVACLVYVLPFAPHQLFWKRQCSHCPVSLLLLSGLIFEEEETGHIYLPIPKNRVTCNQSHRSTKCKSVVFLLPSH